MASLIKVDIFSLTPDACKQFNMRLLILALCLATATANKGRWDQLGPVPSPDNQVTKKCSFDDIELLSGGIFGRPESQGLLYPQYCI